MTDKVKKKRINQEISLGTASKLVEISKARHDLESPGWSKKDIITGLVKAAYKKEITNAKPN